MLQFDKRFKIGTKVQIQDGEPLAKIKEIHPTRFWIKVEGWEGSFQRNHILKFTNK